MRWRRYFLALHRQDQVFGAKTGTFGRAVGMNLQYYCLVSKPINQINTEPSSAAADYCPLLVEHIRFEV